ncbi:MAG TPA: hypothetical protein VFO39_04905 [Candidatus Sulfotelmatobacter sp.]|nr:hypothetical protein [Candidatus Sulfotelmatobacter sp.]
MRRKLLQILLAAATLLCVSCGGEWPTGSLNARPAHVLNGSLYATGGSAHVVASSFAGSVKISNHATATATIGVSINGYLFRNKEEVLAYINSIPPIFNREPDYRKAWRFLTARAYFYTPFSGSRKQHDPLLFLNSLGYGYCDDFANVLATIWKWQGYQSRVWWLNGHVVPEVRASGRWMMFDADIGVYYTDATGNVASVEDLAANPDLILHPIDPIYDSSYVAYDPLIAGFYASTGDNVAMPPDAAESRGMEVDLPAGSEFIFPVDGTRATFQNYATLTAPLYYRAQLKIAELKGDAALQLPLFVVDISGAGKVEIAGRTYDIGSSELSAFFAQFFAVGNYVRPVKSLKVLRGAKTVVISMSLNAFVADGQKTAQVQVFQQSGAVPVEVSYTAAPDDAKAPVAQLLSGVDQRLFQTPYEFTSPTLVFGELGELLSQ